MFISVEELWSYLCFERSVFFTLFGLIKVLTDFQASMLPERFISNVRAQKAKTRWSDLFYNHQEHSVIYTMYK